MKTKTFTPSEEWKAFTALHASGTSPSRLLTAAKTLNDPANRASAILFCGVRTKRQAAETAERQKAIAATTESERRLHCQFSGLRKL